MPGRERLWRFQVLKPTNFGAIRLFVAWDALQPLADTTRSVRRHALSCEKKTSAVVRVDFCLRWVRVGLSDFPTCVEIMSFQMCVTRLCCIVPLVAASCLPHAIPESARRDLVQGDEHYAVGLWVNDWPAGRVAVQLVRIIIQDSDAWWVAAHSRLFGTCLISAHWLDSLMCWRTPPVIFPKPESLKGPSRGIGTRRHLKWPGSLGLQRSAERSGRRHR